MDSLVLDHVGLLLESLVTMFAVERCLFAMNQFVLLQVVGLREALFTDRALERFLACVGHFVSLQAMLVVELSAAKAALQVCFITDLLTQLHGIRCGLLVQMNWH